MKSLTNRSDSTLQHWRNEMNGLLEKFNRDVGLFDTDFETSFPKVEVRDKEKSYFIRAEVPGMEDKDINVTLRENQLIIEGERKTESEKEEKGHYFSEFSYGSFYRAIPLDDEVNQDTVKASYKNGILTVTLDKLGTVAHKSKKIPILKQ